MRAKQADRDGDGEAAGETQSTEFCSRSASTWGIRIWIHNLRCAWIHYWPWIRTFVERFTSYILTEGRARTGRLLTYISGTHFPYNIPQWNGLTPKSFSLCVQHQQFSLIIPRGAHLSSAYSLPTIATIVKQKGPALLTTTILLQSLPTRSTSTHSLLLRFHYHIRPLFSAPSFIPTEA